MQSTLIRAIILKFILGKREGKGNSSWVNVFIFNFTGIVKWIAHLITLKWPLLRTKYFESEI